MSSNQFRFKKVAPVISEQHDPNHSNRYNTQQNGKFHSGVEYQTLQEQPFTYQNDLVLDPHFYSDPAYQNNEISPTTLQPNSTSDGTPDELLEFLQQAMQPKVMFVGTTGTNDTQTQSTDSLEAAAIAAATAVQSSFNRPPLKPAPVKHMKSMALKKISKRDLIEDPSFMDSQENSSKDPTEEASSHVSRSPKKHRTGRKKRKTSTPSSSDTSEERPSKKRKRRNEKSKKKSSERTPMRSPSRACEDTEKDCSTDDEAKDVSMNLDRRGEKVHKIVRTRSPSISRSAYSTKEDDGIPRQASPIKGGGHTFVSPLQPPKSEKRLRTLEENNRVYQEIMGDKPKRSSEPEPDSASKVSSRASTSVSKRNKRPPPVRKPLDIETLSVFLKEELRGTKLAEHTLKTILSTFQCSSQAKRTQVINMVRYIDYVPVVSPPKHLPSIDDKGLLFSMYNKTFGYDFETLNKCSHLREQSIVKALNPLCDTTKHSLDMVFRRSLKEITEEINTFDEEGEIGVENPVFITGEYLELRLLQKIRTYYSANVKEDIATYLTTSSAGFIKESPLSPLVSKSTCEMYVRSLYDRYRIRPENFNQVLHNVSISPLNMRVWTNVPSQVIVNTQLGKHLNEAFAGVRDSTSIEEFMNLVQEYKSQMKPFVKAHRRFLAETLKASELMAWMAFGITTDDAEQGTVHMATSYYFAKCDQERDDSDPRICWNYPLSSLFRREKESVSYHEPIVHFEAFLNAMKSWKMDRCKE